MTLEEFQKHLNQEPPESWLQKTPDGKAKYIPVDIIENELAQDFQGLVKYTVKSERRELNEYIVVSSIEVYHPVLREWLNFDGIGVIKIMQDSGSSIADFATTKKPNALEMNAPNAYSESIKNAAKKIGNKYGRSLNRKFTGDYEPIYTTMAVIEQADLSQCKNIEDLKEMWLQYPELHNSQTFIKAFNSQKIKISHGLTAAK